jgi:hypothetical protein
MVIDVHNDGYPIQEVRVTRQCNNGKLVCNEYLMLGILNMKQSTVRNNTYTLTRYVGTLNSRYDVTGLVLV